MTQTTNLPTDRYLSVRGLRFHYLEWGNKAAPPMVLLHGRSGNAGSWVEVAPVYADRFHVIAPDMRGCGQTDWDPNGLYPMEGFLDDLEQFFTQLNLEPFVFVGHSMGANIALLFTGRHPKRVSRLILEDGGPMAAAHAKLAWKRPLPPLEFASWEEADEKIRNMYPWKISDKDLLRAHQYDLKEAQDGRIVWRGDKKGWLNPELDPEPIMIEGAWEAVRKLECPTLVIRAGVNPILDPGDAEKMVNINSLIQLVVIPDSTHNVHGSQFEAYIKAVDEFLNQASLER